MLKRTLLVFCLALVPTIAQAQAQVQDSYLPSKSQFYFRFDGMTTHQAAYEKTAMGKMMQGDMGKFLEELWKFTEANLKAAAEKEPQIVPLLTDFTKLVSTMHSHGVVVGLAVESVNPPIAQMVLVFPKGATESGTLLPLIQKVAENTGVKVEREKVGKRLISQVSVPFVNLAWWAQGDDAILYIGTAGAVAYAKDIDAKKTGLAKNPMYQKAVGFKEFQTVSRGFFDVASVLKLGASVAPPVGDVINDLGLNGLKSIVFVSGFDGAVERSVVDIDMPSPRKGLLALTSQKKITLKDLPILPDDINGFSASSVNLNNSYDILVNTAEGVVRVFAPNEADNIKEFIKAFEGAVGVDINKDIFGSFGEMMVSYSSPSDGFLGTGAVVAVKIKDSKKLAKSIEKLASAVPANPGGKVEAKRVAYLGGEVIHLKIEGMASSHLATFGIYKDWFIYAQYPQPVKGFIMRQEGKLPAWKPDAVTAKALAVLPKEFTGVQVSDPRPTMKMLLSLAPVVLNMVNAAASPFVPGFRPFDIDLIPHALEATMDLFPNVTITIDDGKRIRTDTRGSILLPF